jgi:hypothetical protein
MDSVASSSLGPCSESVYSWGPWIQARAILAAACAQVSAHHLAARVEDSRAVVACQAGAGVGRIAPHSDYWVLIHLQQITWTRARSSCLLTSMVGETG